MPRIEHGIWSRGVELTRVTLRNGQYTYQVALNGSRLGFFEPIRRRINTLAGYGADETRAWTSLSAGATSGVIGGEPVGSGDCFNGSPDDEAYSRAGEPPFPRQSSVRSQPRTRSSHAR